MKQSDVRKAQDLDRQIRKLNDQVTSAREAKSCFISELGLGEILKLENFDPPSEIGRTFVHVQSSVVRLLEVQLRGLEAELQGLGVELEPR